MDAQQDFAALHQSVPYRVQQVVERKASLWPQQKWQEEVGKAHTVFIVDHGHYHSLSVICCSLQDEIKPLHACFVKQANARLDWIWSFGELAGAIPCTDKWQCHWLI
jgi:hypothetical protein